MLAECYQILNDEKLKDIRDFVTKDPDSLFARLFRFTFFISGDEYLYKAFQQYALTQTKHQTAEK